MKYTITIPTKLSEITLKQYQQFLAVASGDETDDNFLKQKVIQIFCKVELKYVDSMQRKDVESISAKILSLFEVKQKLTQSFKIGSLEFGFIPNLDEMTNGEYMDLDTYITDWKTMHKAMAVLYRPITKQQKNKYLIEPYVSSITYAEVMEFMPLDVALGAVVFFWDLGKELLSSTMNFLEGSKEMQAIQHKHNSETGGVGIHQYMHSLRATLDDLTMLPNSTYTSA